MIFQVYPLILAAMLAVVAFTTPLMLRAAAPILMRAPRLAVALMIASLALWLVTAGGLSLTLAWLFAGPIILPEPLAEVCQRCLEAVRPYSLLAPLEGGIPTAVLLGLPALGVVVLATIGLYRGVRRYSATNRVGQHFAEDAVRRRIHGFDLLICDDPRPLVFSLPRRAGGIVISEGLIQTMDRDELVAVLSHESAHLQQRHHLVVSVLEGVVKPLKWLPIASAVADAVPHYLEIAADSAARHRASTPALASALLKLGDLRMEAPVSIQPSPMLHAAGPERIRFLCSPADTGPARIPVLALVAQVVAFVIAATVTHGPYIIVLIGGCQRLT